MKAYKNYIYIFLIAFCGFLLFKNNIYMPFSDIGREFYIPCEIADGKVIYKDIFNLYAPLGYFINALIVKIFGNSLNVFYSIGFVLSLFILFAFYKIAETFTNKIIAFVSSLFIIFSCMLFPSISNWITPYSYSLLYALCSILFAVYCLIKYIETGKNKYIFLSSMLYGFSLCCKYEYALFGIILGIVLFLNPKHKIFKTLACFLIFPIITLLILFIMKCPIESLFESLKYALKLSESEAVKFFYAYSGFGFSFSNLKFALKAIFYPNPAFTFASMGYICIAVFIYSLITKCYDKKFLILNFSAILISIKCLGGINLEIYGTFFLPLLFLVFISFLLLLGQKTNVCLPPSQTLPLEGGGQGGGEKNAHKLITRIIKKIHSILILFISSLTILYLHYDISHNNLLSIKTTKGTIKVNEEFYEGTKDILQYIENNINRDKKILILPEGVLINYLTERETENYLFYLIPPNMEIFTKEFVINKIKKEKPKYIVISNIIYPWYNQTSFYESWGINITNYIKIKYNYKNTIGNKMKFYVYERK